MSTAYAFSRRPFASIAAATGSSSTTRMRMGCSLHVELEQQHVAVRDDVVLSFHAVESLLPRRGDRAAGDEVVVGNRLRLDEAALEVGVDDAGRLRRSVSDLDGPGADLLFTGGEVGLQAEQMVSGADQSVHAAFLHPELTEVGLRFGGLEIHQIAFDLRA